MGIRVWKSILFFACILFVAYELFPSGRMMGRLYLQGQEFDKAVFYLEKQYHQDPSDTANCRRYLEALLEKGDMKNFEKVAREITARHFDTADIQEILARYYESILDIDSAAACWKRILQHDIKQEDVRDQLIAYLLDRKQYRDLAEVYERWIAAGDAPVDIYYELGRIYLHEKDMVRARRVYRDLILKVPDEFDANFFLALTYESTGDTAQAVEVYCKLFEMSGITEERECMLADKLIELKQYEIAKARLLALRKKYPNSIRELELLGSLYMRTGEKDAAYDIYKKIYESFPGQTSALKEMASFEFDRGHYDAAAELLRMYLKNNGDDSDAAAFLASILYWNLDRKDEAIWMLEKLRAEQPNNVAFLKSLGEFYNGTGNYGRALEMFNAYNAKTGGSYEVSMLMASLLWNLNRVEEAKLVAAKLFADRKAHADSYKELGRILTDLGDYERAVLVLKEACRNETDDEALYLLANSYKATGRKREAAAIAQRLWYKRPEYPELVALLCELYADDRQYDRAFYLIKKYRARKGDDLQIALVEVEVLRKKGDIQEAAKACAILVDRYPEKIELAKELAIIYNDMGLYQQAKDMLEVYHAKASGDYLSHHLLGDILAELGDTIGSEREYSRALELIRKKDRR